MRVFCSMLLCMTLFLVFPFGCAEAQGLMDSLSEAADLDRLLDGLSETEQSMLGSPEDGGFDSGGAMKHFWEDLKARTLSQLRDQFSFGVRLLILIIICTICDALVDSEAGHETIALSASVCAALWIAGDWNSGIQQATETLGRLSDYSRAVLPVLYTAAASSGAMGSAPVKYAASSLALEMLMTISQSWILPLIYAYLSLSLTGCICENPLLRALQRAVKWCAAVMMSGLTTAFCAYIGLSGLIAGSSDALAVKAVRTVLSGALPVVGGILSDSAATLLSAAAVIRSTAGTFSLIAVCILCAGPFVFLSLKLLLLRTVSVLAGLLPGGALARFLEESSNVFALLLGLIGMNSVLLFFSIMSGMKAVSTA